MTMLTPNAQNHGALHPLASRLVRVDELPWEPTKLPGIVTKTLVFDKDSGMMTVLMKMDPGAVLPDHEHALVEQTWVLEGRLVDLDGPDAGLEVRPGEFVWRPKGSRHAAWMPEGGLTLAIFQIPNKFFNDGKAVDILGFDWDATWGSG